MANKRNAKSTIIEPVFHPKPGPTQVFITELVGMRTGHARRYRNIGASQLVLAFERGKLASPNDDKITQDHRKLAGEQFEKMFSTLHGTTRDSTDVSVHATDGLFLTERREDAGRKIARLKRTMARANFLIVERFCGYGFTMVESLRGVVECHPDGTAHRVREALNELVIVTGVASIANQCQSSPIRAEIIHPFQSDNA